MAEITGILLAAGSSTRFGDNKLLHQIDAKPVIAYSAETLRCCDRIIAVVREDAALQAVLSALDIECLINRQAERGMGHSIACAVNASQDSDGWCLLPADMPYIKPSTTQRVIDALATDAELAAPFYQGRRGHPVAISHRFVRLLSALDGDTGARHIIERNIGLMTSIDCDDSGVLIDIDVPADII
jgi:molybdenum cofactor cytidylyltransferase